VNNLPLVVTKDTVGVVGVVDVEEVIIEKKTPIKISLSGYK
jgi:hypothetical protein